MLFPEKDWIVASPEDVGLDGRRVDEAMAAVARVSGGDGNRQCLVIRDGCLVWHGPEIDRVHSVWSCTKSFLSLTMGLLIDDGRCTLDTRAADLYPALEAEYPTVTLRHLVTFTSGYRPRAGSSREAPFEPASPLFAPGERFHYWWESYLLALLLTKVAGESLEDLFRRRIAEPIGLDPASWRWGDCGWGTFDEITGLRGVKVCGGSGLYGRGVSISARSMARVGWLVANGGRWGDRQLVSSAWIEESTRPQVPATTPAQDPAAWYAKLPGRYGYYWWTNGADASGRRLWPSAPERTFAMQGHENNICLIVPEWRLVLVRLGADQVLYGEEYDEVLAALGRAAGEKS